MSAEDRNLEKRGGGKERLGGTLVGWLIRLYNATLRLEVVDRAGVQDERFSGGAMLAIWHNRLFVIGPVWQKSSEPRKTAVLTSASSDGAVVSSVMAVFGFEAVRGSSSRRGRAAMVGVMRKIKEKCFVGITPDGPRGPRYVIQGGVVKLAQACQVPIIPIRVELSKAWHLNSWDRFCIPYPFSKVTVIYEPALDVPRELSEVEFEEQRLQIQTVLRKGIDDLLPESDEDN